jgi:hypothetical protein
MKAPRGISRRFAVALLWRNGGTGYGAQQVSSGGAARGAVQSTIETLRWTKRVQSGSKLAGFRRKIEQ